jgi:hypothetical protein
MLRGGGSQARGGRQPWHSRELFEDRVFSENAEGAKTERGFCRVQLSDAMSSSGSLRL